ncbi:Regulator of MON1-CCZ1 complex [Eumeta japonica]|uniref:Regulator of MON1-CCZ1 complex n=1 Tax=Eumeta variegata TaxID=151549 RepID=A0A4C1Y285_EUMVA|nr:Regulator of MON1-CCZ1 complex [Eumeta japonica]
MPNFCLKESSQYYLQLSQQPIRFDAVSSVTNVFFDDANGQWTQASRPVSERDVYILKVSEITWCALLRHGTSLSVPGPAELFLMPLTGTPGSNPTHILKTGLVGRFALNIVDELIVVHHQASQTSLLFDIMEESKLENGTVLHIPIITPVSLKPFILEDQPCPMCSLWKVELIQSGIANNIPKDEISKVIATLLRRSNSKETIYNILNQLVEEADEHLMEISKVFDEINLVYRKWLDLEIARNTAQSASQCEIRKPTTPSALITQRDLHARVFQPHADAKYLVQRFPGRLPFRNAFQNTYRRLCETGNLQSNETRVVVVWHNVRIDEQILRLFEEDGTRSIRNVASLLKIFIWKVWKVLHQNNKRAFQYTPVQDVDDPDFLKSILWRDESKFTKGGILNLHNLHHWSSKDENPRVKRHRSFQRRFSLNVWAGVITSYISSLSKLDIPIDSCISEECSKSLVVHGRFARLRQSVRHGCLGDGRGLACLLLSLGNLDPAAAQLALDMLTRLKAHEEVVEVLLGWSESVAAAGVARTSVPVWRSLPARKLLAATSDPAAFVTLYHTLEQRNRQTRGVSDFLKGEQCENFVQYYKDVTKDPN